MRTGLTILVVLAICPVSAQVRVNKSVHFTSSDSTRNQALRLSEPGGYGDVSTIRTTATNYLIHGTIDSAHMMNDTLHLTLPVPITMYSTGMRLRFRSEVVTDSAVFIQTGSLPPVPIVKNADEVLDSADIVPNMEIDLIYDGIHFQWMNFTQACPSGFTPVDASYCIETNENPNAKFWDAIQDCNRKNAALCSLTDWYYACQKTGLGLNNMTDNWEWINHGMDHTSDAAVAGNGQCSTTSTAQTETWQNGSAFYRCCYYR